MGKSFLRASAGVMALAAATGSAYAQANGDLETRVQKLEQQQTDDHVRLTTLEQLFADPQWTFDYARPQVQSGDLRFMMAIRARFQMDTASFMQKDSAHGNSAANPIPAGTQRDLASGSVMRRAYIGVEGRAFYDFWYEFRLNFGGTNAESGDIINLARIAYVYNWNTAYPSQPHFRINFGIIQPIMTFEDTVSSSATTFMERGAVVNVVTSIGGKDPRRGIELTFQQADIFNVGDNLVLSGAFTGAPAATTVNNVGDEGTNLVGRAAYRLWSDGTGNVSFANVQVGVTGATTLSMTGGPTPGAARNFTFSERPEVRVDGTQIANTGGIPTKTAWAYGFDAAANFHNFYAFGEYYKLGIDRDRNCTACSTTAQSPNFYGWYVGASWIVTGEWKPYSASATNNEMGAFAAPIPIQPFSLAGGTWGAWELAARYSELNLNYKEGANGTAIDNTIGAIRGGDQKIWTAGVNWYLNRNVRMLFDWQNVNIDKLNNNGTQGGQKFNVASFRVQFTN